MRNQPNRLIHMQKPPHANSLGRILQTRAGIVERDVVVNRIARSGFLSSIKTPGWKSMTARQRKEVNNPFTYIYENTVRKPGVISYFQFDWSERLTTGDLGHDQCSSIVYPTFGEDDSDAKAKSKLLSRMKDSSINLGQAFAERKQTVGLLAKTVNRLASGALAIRRGNLKHASELFGVKVTGSSLRRDATLLHFPGGSNKSRKSYSRQTLENDAFGRHWLEFSYGWRPLVNDIYGAAEAIAKTFSDVPKRTVISAVGNYEKVSKGVFTGTGLGVNLTSTLKSKTRYVVAFGEEDSFAVAMRQTGLSNPLLLLWELTPWSFVADWVFPLGAYLRHLDASHGLVFKRGTVSQRRLSVHESTAFADPGYVGPGHSASGGGESKFVETKTRSPLSGFPCPDFPTVSLGLSVSQAISGLALLQQVFKKTI